MIIVESKREKAATIHMDTHGLWNVYIVVLLHAETQGRRVI